MPVQIQLKNQWNGLPALKSEHTIVSVKGLHNSLSIAFEGQLNPVFTAPNIPPEFTHGLWKYDVLEVFFVRPDGSYLEIEIGPSGHWLVYEFASYRKIADKNPRPLVYTYHVKNLIWQGKLEVPNAWLRTPVARCRVNFYQIRTSDQGHEYLAWRSIPTIEPDFHLTECFTFLPT
ncbi:MAG: hypothetical protein Greene071421_315 [Parcubacteria group bacterium Greene0714_21]|nr:MAG: hypothetical protein Greene041639_133 [Parcubacteria group bacterium Greene0416_39]TSC98057.1 MAG: hypothetical protein Greene101447_220 [Parcubacteria group bacterium Greene1014_47]TSD04153.1 MAG: hypothetical protein Greene071421_315 [Parcubacteria group bacterium Greene0714_21]